MTYIKNPQINSEDKYSCLAYAALVDDLCVFLIELEKDFLKSKRIYFENVVGGIFNFNQLPEGKKISENQYMISTAVVDTIMTLDQNLISEIKLIFKTLNNENDEFVVDTVKSYLPKNIEFKSKKDNIVKYLSDDGVSFRIEYFRNNDMLVAVIE